MPREELLAGFDRGGTWDARAPGPDLAVALAAAAGPGWRCRGASGEQLIGVLGRLAAVESWAAAGKLGVIRALIRDDDPGFLCGSRHGDLPDVWDDGLAGEIALALAASVPSADKTMRAAWELGARLPEIGALLEAGVLDAPKARLVAEVFRDLSDESAGRAEALIVSELTEPPAKTYAQVEQIATAIALIVDPRLGERQRKAAEKHAARVHMFRERAGTAGLSGRDLPTDQTLAAYANVNARAARYKDSKVFAKARMDQLRAAAYLDLLNGVTAEDRIAHGLLTEQTPADDQAGTDRAAAGGPGPSGGPNPGGDDCPCRECDGSCLPDDDTDADGPDGDGPDGDGPDGDGPDGDGPDDNGPGGDPRDHGPDGGNSSEGGPGAGGGEPGHGDGGEPGRRRRRRRWRLPRRGAGRWRRPRGRPRRRPQGRRARWRAWSGLSAAAFPIPGFDGRAAPGAAGPHRPAGHAARPGRCPRRRTRTRRPRPRPMPNPRRHRGRKPAHHHLHHHHRHRRHRHRPRLRQTPPIPHADRRRAGPARWSRSPPASTSPPPQTG